VREVNPEHLRTGDRVRWILAADRKGGSNFRGTIVSIDPHYYGTGNYRVTLILEADTVPQSYNWPPDLKVTIE
jgi:hypothetical protein